MLSATTRVVITGITQGGLITFEYGPEIAGISTIENDFDTPVMFYTWDLWATEQFGIISTNHQLTTGNTFTILRDCEDHPVQMIFRNDLGWWDAQSKSFNINKMQEDLYLLMNKDKIFQKIAGESAAQRYQHHLKISNNIKLNGVNNQMDIPTGQQLDEKAKQKQVADAIWSI